MRLKKLLLPWVYLWSVQSFSHVQHFVTPGTAAHQASLSITNSQSLLKLMSIEPSHPLWSSSPLAFNLSQHQGLFQWDLHIRWPKYCSCSFSIGPSNEYLGLISFRIYWFDFLAVQGILQESSPASLFDSINFWALSLLYGPALTSIHDIDLTYGPLLAKWCLCFWIC